MRGKHTAKAARRDADAAQLRAEQLQERFDTYRADTDEQLRQQRITNQRLHDQLLKQVETLAAERVEQARLEHAEQVEEVRSKHYSLLVTIVDMLWQDTSMSSDTLHRIMEVANVKMGDVPSAAKQATTERGLRRAGSREAAQRSRHNISNGKGILTGANGPHVGLTTLRLIDMGTGGAQEPDGPAEDASGCEDPAGQLST